MSTHEHTPDELMHAFFRCVYTVTIPLIHARIKKT